MALCGLQYWSYPNPGGISRLIWLWKTCLPPIHARLHASVPPCRCRPGGRWTWEAVPVPMISNPPTGSRHSRDQEVPGTAIVPPVKTQSDQPALATAASGKASTFHPPHLAPDDRLSRLQHAHLGQLGAACLVALLWWPASLPASSSPSIVSGGRQNRGKACLCCRAKRFLLATPRARGMSSLSQRPQTPQFRLV